MLASRTSNFLSHSQLPRRLLSTSSRFSSSNGVGAPLLMGFGLGAAAGMILMKSSESEAAPVSRNRKVVVSTPDAPAAVGPYSQAIVDAGSGTVYCSGQVGLVPGTKQLVSDKVDEQTRQVLTNLSKVLEEAGSSMENVMKTTVLLADINDYAIVNQEYSKFFVGDRPPARAAFAVKDLPLGAKVEIDAVAVKKN